MDLVGQAIIYVMMAFVVIGAVSAVIDDTRGFGREFKEGIYSIGPIFLPVAGVMIFLPILTNLVERFLAPVYGWFHADASVAATTVIAGDLGGYQLSNATAASHGIWIMAFAISMTAGATLIYSIPVGLAMLDKRDHKYLALGMMSGLLTIPVAVLVTMVVLQVTSTPLRDEVSTTSPSTKPFDLPASELVLNLLPLAVIMVALALGLRFFTPFMVKLFMALGRTLDAILKLGLAVAIVEYFTGLFSRIFGGWVLDPFIADEADQFRALEIAGYIGVMLAGAFPMVYAIRTWLRGPLHRAGSRFGFSEEGAAGVIAGAVNIQALYRLIQLMPPRDKVLTTAFAVCAAYSLGDHLAFVANFQPNMVFPLVLGKLTAGVLAMILAVKLSLPEANRLEQIDREQGIIGAEEYRPAMAATTPAPGFQRTGIEDSLRAGFQGPPGDEPEPPTVPADERNRP